jgi:uncharacterized membrane protein
MTSPPEPSNHGANDAFLQGVISGLHTEIAEHRSGFIRSLRTYRACFTVAAISTVAVPIMAGVPSIPRWVLGVCGGLATVIDLLVAMWQLRRSVLSNMRTANGIERVLRQYVVRLPPYDCTDETERFNRFYADIELIRSRAEDEFLSAWESMPAIPGARVEAVRTLTGSPRSTGD